VKFGDKKGEEDSVFRIADLEDTNNAALLVKCLAIISLLVKLITALFEEQESDVPLLDSRESEASQSLLIIPQTSQIEEVPQTLSTEIVADIPPLNEPKQSPIQDDSSELVKEVKSIINQNTPESVILCEEGVGGTYFIQDDDNGKKLAVFKPSDEEPGAVNNPKDALSNPLLPPGGGAIREVAAYLLDRGFAGVPETVLINNVQHDGLSSKNGLIIPKSGSLQRYIDNIGNSGDMGSSRFSVEDVHKIGILDIRLFNMDRNAENMLVQKSLTAPTTPCYSLVPIDHTYILPPSLDSAWFEWQHWKQAKQPFSPSNLAYIESLDIYQDAQILRQIGLDFPGIRSMIISTTLLQIGAQYGLTLFDISSMISRRTPTTPSALEQMVERTEQTLLLRYPNWSETAQLSDEKIDIFLQELKSIIIEEIRIKTGVLKG